MKRILIIFFVVIIFMPVLSFFAFAGDGNIDNYKDEFSYDEMISNIDSSVVDILNEIGITEISFESVFSVTPKKVFDSFFYVFSGALKEPFEIFLSVSGVMAIMALLTNLSRSPETVTLIGSSCVACILAVPMVSLVTRTFSVLETLSSFTTAFSGVFCAVSSASGGVVQGTAFIGMNVAINSVFSVVLSKVSNPLSYCMCSLAFLSCFNIKTFSERMSDLFKRCYIFLLGLITTLFSGISAIKTILGGSADSVASRGIKFLVGRSLPLVGGVVSESYQSIIASLGLIKSTVGVFGIITVVITVLPIIAELVSWWLTLTFIATTSEIFGCFKIENFINIFKDVIILLIATVSFSALLFIISCGFMLIFRGSV